MLKVLILAAQHTVSEARMEVLIRDRLIWLYCLGFNLGAPPPNADTIRLNRVDAKGTLFASFDRCLRERGYLPMGGQIVDATLVAALRRRNTRGEGRVKAGRTAAEIWPDEPAKAAQKDTDARWTLKFAKARPLENGKPGADIAIPSIGDMCSISICRFFGFIRDGKAKDAAMFDGRMLRDVVTTDNAASDVWDDTAYRSQANEIWLQRHGRVSRISRKKLRRRPMSDRTTQANPKKSSVRARIEHVFARQKGAMGLVIRTTGIARAAAKVTLANLAYNMERLVVFRERRAAMGLLRPDERKSAPQRPSVSEPGDAGRPKRI